VCASQCAWLCVLLLGWAACQGRTLTEKELDAGIEPQPGDEVVLRDFSRLTPKAALSPTSERGQWWLRPYRLKDGSERTMLMTIERDMDKPATCIVPAVTYPLSLKGWYEVWVATWRGPYGGGVDVRLTSDDCFVHIDPQQVTHHKGGPKTRVGAIVELNYKPAADLTGQSLVFQQPFGTYESFHWGFCEASLAYVRLVRLSDEQVAAFKADQARTDRRVIAFDDDNFSRYWMWGGENANKILRVFEPFRYHDIAFFGLCLGTTTNLKVPTPHSDLKINRGARLGDKRMKTVYRDFAVNGVDMLKIAADRAHKYGFKLLPTLRMSSGGGGPHHKALSKYYLKTCHRLDFAYPQVRDHYVKMIRYILEHWDVDGFILDFTRHCVHFNPDEPNKYEHMNHFCAAMRKMVDAVSAKKGRKLLLAASFAESDYASGFARHCLKVNVKAADRLAIQGIDVAAWVRNSYFDILMPEGPNIEKHVAITRGTTTKCFPRWTYTRTLYSTPLGRGIHDPQASEDKTDRPINPHCGPLDYEAGWLKIQGKGADGLYLFNNPKGWATLRRMGHLDEVRTRVAVGQVHALIEGPIIEFAK